MVVLDDYRYSYCSSYYITGSRYNPRPTDTAVVLVMPLVPHVAQLLLGLVLGYALQYIGLVYLWH